MMVRSPLSQQLHLLELRLLPVMYVVTQEQKRLQNCQKKVIQISQSHHPIQEKPSTPDDTKKDDGKTDNTKPAVPKKDNTTVVTPVKPVVNTVKVGTKFVVAGHTYKVTKTGKEVSFIQAKKNAKRVVIPATVKSKGVTYKVTSVAGKSCKKQ